MKQACAVALQGPIVRCQELESLRDHCNVLRQALPRAGRTGPVMREIEALCGQITCRPETLLQWRQLLGVLHGIAGTLAENVEWLCDHWRSRQRESLDETVYWMKAMAARIEALRGNVLLAPWLDQEVDCQAWGGKLLPVWA